MKKIRGVVVSLVCAVLCGALYFCGLFDFFENKTYDLRIKSTAGNVESDDSICFVIVDQESIDWAKEKMGWGWPWPRNAYGDLVRFMNAGGASSVVFDLLFTEQSVYGEKDDEDFASACRDYGKVVHTVYDSDGLLYPVECIKNSAAILANITSTKDSDDIIRRTQLECDIEGVHTVSLGTAPFILKYGQEAFDRQKKNLPYVKDGKNSHGDDTLLLRYRKNIDDYMPYRMSDLLESYYNWKAGKPSDYVPEDFKDMTVFCAYYAPGLFDICSTPVSQVYPGVGVHITAYDNFVNDSFMNKVPVWVSLCIILVCAFAGAFVIVVCGKCRSQTKGSVLSVMLFLVLFGAVIGLNVLLFANGFYAPVIGPLVSLSVAFVSELLLEYMTEGKQKKFIKTAFSQYLSPAVIDQIVQNPSKLQLGGEKRCISIYFSDIQSFTSISEGLADDPEKLTDVLNRYLTKMTDAIMEAGGTIDKYMGDSIVAFWNAPAEQADHGRRAVETAMKCQELLDQMRGELKALCGKDLYQRIGLNTGYAVVGNMGSSKRFNYSMLGDSVNLASRLEGINKYFGTYTCCSEAVKIEAEKHGSELCWRELGRVEVVGKTEAVTIYEPMRRTVYESRKQELSVFEKALDCFYSKDFQKAMQLFDTIRQVDGAAMKYSQKCRELLLNPPEEWHGVWVATSK